jgi:hypothetical protein
LEDIAVIMEICRSVVVGVGGLRIKEARVVINVVELTFEAEVTRSTCKVDIGSHNPDESQYIAVTTPSSKTQSC